MSDCKALLETSTPYLYQRNAFRVTGLPADVSIRDIKRRIDDLKHAEEIGEIDDENSHAFSLTLPPTLDHIREAAQILQDPEKRIVQEFYWFWPFEWGKGKTDPALVALSKGDKTAAFNIWKTSLIGHPEAIMLISKHNLAILYQLIALDEELVNLQKNPSEETLKQIDKYWRSSFKFWEEIIGEDHFWDLVTDRILSAGDPRLTSAFALSMRSTLPKALQMINGKLALLYVENKKMNMAGKHAEYIANTYQEHAEDISTIFDLITKPMQTRVRDAVDIATKISEHQPEKSADAATDLFKTVAQPVEILKKLLPKKNHTLIDLLDSVAEAALSCQKAYARDRKDWKRCFTILESAKNYAVSSDVVTRINEQSTYIKDASYLAPIFTISEEAGLVAKNNPEEALSAGNRLLVAAQPLLVELEASDASDTVKNRAKDEVAGTLAQCAIAYGNKMEEWKSSVGLLETAQGLAVGGELREFIERNLQISRQNISFGVLKPISSAPSLSTWNGMGFRLYGNTDHDAASNSHLSTYYFVFLFIPLFPICRYRVIPTNNGYRFLGKVPLRRFDKIHLIISLLLTALFIFNIANNESGPSSRYSSTPSATNSSVSSPPSSYNSSERASLRTEIEDGKRRAKEMEDQLRQMDNQINDYNSQLDMYKSEQMVEEYNMLVPTYNDLVRRRKALYRRYDELVNEVNNKVNQYNAR